MSMMVLFVLSFFPRRVLDEILNLIESVSEGFPSYSCLVCNFSIVATCPSIQLPALLFVCVLFLLFVDVISGEPRQN